MNHLDLFSGIGGFAYAAREVWGNEYNCIAFCDNNKFCQEVIKKNFGKDSVIYGDIKELTANSYGNRLQKQRTEQQTSGDRQLPEIDLCTGGFPCQPFSQAGKRKGTADNRYLWPEMFRVINEFQPRWVIAENVRGLLTQENGMVFKQVCADLEASNYEIQSFIIPACAINAPHRRDRIWIIAHTKSERSRGSAGNKCGIQEPKLESDKPEGNSLRGESEGCLGIITNSVSNGHKNRYSETRGTDRKSEQGRMCELKGKDSSASDSAGRRLQEHGTQSESQADISKQNLSDAPDTNTERLQGWNELGQSAGEKFIASQSWESNWLKVATELCGVDDGLPAELDGFKLTKSGHRIERLKALGNAIVPQVAMKIMQAIKDIEEGRQQVLPTQ